MPGDVGAAVELGDVVVVGVGADVDVTLVVVGTVVVGGAGVDVAGGRSCTVNVASTEKLADAEKPALADGADESAGSGGTAELVGVSVGSAGG